MSKYKLLKCIRYKVVKRSRCSTVIHGNSKYALKYEKGTDVFARPETVGIMTFKTLSAAWEWASSISFWLGDGAKVLRVQPFGKGHVPISIPSPSRLFEFYKNPERFRRNHLTQTTPDGTLCYPGVRVLE